MEVEKTFADEPYKKVTNDYFNLLLGAKLMRDQNELEDSNDTSEDSKEYEAGEEDSFAQNNRLKKAKQTKEKAVSERTKLNNELKAMLTVCSRRLVLTVVGTLLSWNFAGRRGGS